MFVILWEQFYLCQRCVDSTDTVVTCIKITPPPNNFMSFLLQVCVDLATTPRRLQPPFYSSMYVSSSSSSSSSFPHHRHHHAIHNLNISLPPSESRGAVLHSPGDACGLQDSGEICCRAAQRNAGAAHQQGKREQRLQLSLMRRNLCMHPLTAIRDRFRCLT